MLAWLFAPRFLYYSEITALNAVFSNLNMAFSHRDPPPASASLFV